MFRSSSKLAVLTTIMVGLVPCLALGQEVSATTDTSPSAPVSQEAIGADGFPAEWKPSDFAIGKEIISKTMVTRSFVAVSNTIEGVTVSGTVANPTMVVAVTNAALDARGVLNLGTGGEAPNVWQKANRPETEAALKRGVSQGVASPALREGWRRLLLTEAEAPKVTDKGLRPGWIAVRNDTLQKLGLFEASLALWKDVPASTPMDDATAQAWVQSRLLAGQSADACAMAKGRALANGSGGDWGPIMAVCGLVGNASSPAAASLSLQVVEPTLKARNPTLLRILMAVQDGRQLSSLGAGPTAMADGLGGAVLATYPALVGAEILPRMPDVSLRRLVGSAALPEELRGRAAVALARQTGLPLDGKTAWQLVSSTEFAGTLPDAVVVAREVKGISGSEAGIYARAALRLGMTDAAAKVLPKWDADGLNATESRERIQTQLTLEALQGKIDDRTWDLWILAQPLDVQTGVRQAQRTLLVVEGLGVGVPARIWQQMHDRGIAVSGILDPAWQRLLAAAVRDEAVPASLSLMSEAWGGQPPAGVVPVVMGASVEALRRMGMDDVARRVAAEALLGIPASHLIPMVVEKGEVVSSSQPVAIGADTVSPTVLPVSEDGIVLPPPRVDVPKVTKPMVKAPTKPVVPKVGH